MPHIKDAIIYATSLRGVYIAKRYMNQINICVTVCSQTKAISSTKGREKPAGNAA